MTLIATPCTSVQQYDPINQKCYPKCVNGAVYNPLTRTCAGSAAYTSLDAVTPQCSPGYFVAVDPNSQQGTCVLACPTGYYAQGNYCVNNVNAQYITIVQSQRGILHLSEVEVYSKALSPDPTTNPNLMLQVSDSSVTYKSIDSTSSISKLKDGDANTYYKSDENNPTSGEYIKIDLGTIRPIAQIIIRNRKNGYQSRANGIVVTLTTDTQNLYTSSMFTDATGSSVYSDSSLGYNTFTLYPPNPTVTGTDIATPCPGAYDPDNRLCYSPVCGTDFSYDVPTKSCVYVGTNKTPQTHEPLTFMANAQCAGNAYITPNNKCVLACPANTTLQDKFYCVLNTPPPPKTVITKDQKNKQNQKLGLSIGIPAICTAAVLFMTSARK